MGRYNLSSPAFCATVTGFPTTGTATTAISASIQVTDTGSGTIASVALSPGDGSADVALTASGMNYTGSVTYAKAGTWKPVAKITFSNSSIVTEIPLECIVIS